MNQDFNEIEKQLQESIKKTKVNLSGKQTAGELAAIFISNLLTKKSYQRSLFFYLLITIPVGTYHSIKFIINLFF